MIGITYRRVSHGSVVPAMSGGTVTRDRSLSGAGTSETTSEEVDDRQLELARRAGDAYLDALDDTIEEVADVGRTREVADYVVGFAAEEAEGLYVPSDGDPEWREPDDENCHVEVTFEGVYIETGQS